MTTAQALAILTALLNAPVIKLAVGIADLAACDAALKALAEAISDQPSAVSGQPDLQPPLSTP